MAHGLTEFFVDSFNGGRVIRLEQVNSPETEAAASWQGRRHARERAGLRVSEQVVPAQKDCPQGSWSLACRLLKHSITKGVDRCLAHGLHLSRYIN